MSKQPDKKDNDTWVQVAETIGSLQAEITAGALRTYGIPVYIDVDNARSIFPSSAFGTLAGLVRIYVPEAYFEDAMSILEDDGEFEDFYPDEIDDHL